jgi:hypothetical protein
MQDLQLLGATASFNKTMLRKVGAFQVPYGIMIRVSHLNNAPIHLRSSYQFWSVPYPTLPLEPRTSLRHRSRSWRAPDTCSKSENTQQRKNYDDIFIWWLWLNNLYIYTYKHIDACSYILLSSLLFLWRLLFIAIILVIQCISGTQRDTTTSSPGISWCRAWPLHHLLNAESGIGLEQGHPPCYEFIAGRCQ